MRILVDSDSLKPRFREIIARAASRHGARAVFVANRSLPPPTGFESSEVEMVVTDDADEWLAAEASSGDLAITRDVPLAARLVDREVEVISDHGERFTRENIRKRLSEREFAMHLREAGVIGGRGRVRGTSETSAFANLLDRVLTARTKAGGSVDDDD